MILTKAEIENLRNEILKEKERVVWLYKNWPTTIHSDNFLIDYYKLFFGSTDKKEDTIKRCGRKLREHHKLCKDDYCLQNTPLACFRRTEEEVMKATEMEIIHRELYAKG